ncbi:hypothetical protein M9458_051879, partial [Cirrhinus mrigala]
ATGHPLSTALPVMAVDILSVWAGHCTPEASPVHESVSEGSPINESTPEPPEVVVPVHELTACPVTAKKAVQELTACSATVKSSIYVPSPPWIPALLAPPCLPTLPTPPWLHASVLLLYGFSVCLCSMALVLQCFM